MFHRTFKRILFLIAALSLVGPLTHHAKAKSCQCGSVVINRLWLATTRDAGSPPTYDVYYIAGSSFEVNRGYDPYPEEGVDGVDFETSDDFSLRVQEDQPFQVTMGTVHQ